MPFAGPNPGKHPSCSRFGRGKQKSTEGCLRSCDALEACENMRTIAPTVRIRTQSSILFFKPLLFWLVLSFSYRLRGCCVICSSLRHFLVDSVVQGFRLYSDFWVWAEIAPRPVHPPREMTSGDSGARREADGSGFLPQLFSTGRPWITQQHGQLHAVLYPLGLLSSSPPEVEHIRKPWFHERVETNISTSACPNHKRSSMNYIHTHPKLPRLIPKHESVKSKPIPPIPLYLGPKLALNPKLHPKPKQFKIMSAT